MIAKSKIQTVAVCLTLLIAGLSMSSNALAESSNAKDEIVREMTNMLIVSAEKGNANSQMELGHLYAIGDGVPKDKVFACKWLILAAEKGYKTAILDEIKKRLTEKDLKRAIKMAEEWKKGIKH